MAYNRIRPRTFATDEKRAQALELFRHGIGYIRASRILDMSPNTLRDWRRAFLKGSFKVDLADNQYRYPKAVRERAIRLRLQGYSWSEVTKMTGIS
ncbi:helix-turn-helix domain-containing protein [Sutterella faecalis]|uniref:Helix-turn-helix domain-containing protein n=2 Tax=Sutterella TaxID=40544 RepID=A0AAI9S9Y5_9BURK|nr:MULTISPECIES: helix-turn-helix domain-containing protein [Sutterella]KAB7649338.1 helix-turn-helix domain-containing protein [Sutterella seckii]QDA54530.1 helix-turn-helix domain-containing protein [Sutterella faecalis]